MGQPLPAFSLTEPLTSIFSILSSSHSLFGQFLKSLVSVRLDPPTKRQNPGAVKALNGAAECQSALKANGPHSTNPAWTSWGFVASWLTYRERSAVSFPFLWQTMALLSSGPSTFLQTQLICQPDVTDCEKNDLKKAKCFAEGRAVEQSRNTGLGNNSCEMERCKK